MRWRPTVALMGSDLLAVGLLLLSLLLRRPDGVALAAPFLAYSGWSRVRRPRSAPRPTVDTAEGVVRVSPGVADDQRLLATVGWPRQPGLSLAEPARGSRTQPAEDAAVGEFASSRYGVQDLGPLRLVLADSIGAFRAEERFTGLQLASRPPSPRSAGAGSLKDPIGTLGQHHSPRPGSGTTLADVRPHAPGDERRRINWRVTARLRTLHTNTTDRDRDTDILLVADTRYGLSSGRASLDVTADAVVALVQAFAAQGDRVAVADTSGRLRAVPPGTGRRQALRAVEAVGQMPHSGRDRQHVQRPLPRVRSGTVVIVCSPLLHDGVLAELGTLASRGCQCLVIDTLPCSPTGLDTGALDAAQRRLVLRLRRLEREPLLARLGEAGIPVLPWAGASTLRAVTTTLAHGRPAVRRRA